MTYIEALARQIDWTGSLDSLADAFAAAARQPQLEGSGVAPIDAAVRAPLRGPIKRPALPVQFRRERMAA